MKLIGITLMIVLSRLLIMLGPEWANFSPLGAFAIYMGCKYGVKGGVLTFITCWVSDVLINHLYYQEYSTSLWPSSSVFLFTLTSAIAYNMKNVVLMNLTGVMTFFILSNFIVWTGTMYPHTLEGLSMCYIYAIPFLKNALISQFLFIFALQSVTKYTLVRKTSEIVY